MDFVNILIRMLIYSTEMGNTLRSWRQMLRDNEVSLLQCSELAGLLRFIGICWYFSKRHIQYFSRNLKHFLGICLDAMYHENDWLDDKA